MKPVILWLCSGSMAMASGVTERLVEHQDKLFLVVEINLHHAELALVGQEDPTLRSLSAVVQQPGVLAATNAGMYHEDRRPVGLHIERGRLYAPRVTGPSQGNFGMLPNAIFYVGPSGAGVVNTTAWEGVVEQTLIATQSGPALVLDGVLHPRFSSTSPSMRLRSGVGVRDPQSVIWVISDDLVRFHELATLFRDVLHCPNALYLDGTVSQMWTRQRSDRPVSGVFSGILVAREAQTMSGLPE